MKKATIFKIRNIGVVCCALVIAIIILYSCITSDKEDNEELKLDLDSFSIESVTEEQKCKVVDSFNALLTSWSDSGKNSGVKDIEFDEEDRDKVRFSAKKITGLKTINVTLAEDKTVHWEINSSLSKGKAKIIIVMDKDVVLKECEAGENVDFTYQATGKHEFYVKILCEEAQIEIEAMRTIN